MVILTGDTHGDFDRIIEFCQEYDLNREDIMVILGDAGINYHLNYRDEYLKQELSQLDVTLFCVHGNHEERPENIDGYEEIEWHGGMVYVEEEYPNILFAKDGEIYDFDGKKVLVIGGAYSVDKYYRLAHGMNWFESEQPDDFIKARVEQNLDKLGWKVDCVFSHTVPYKYRPVHAFLPTIDQSRVDTTTEKWLDTIEERLEYNNWYAGHYHVEWSTDKMRLMFEEYEELGE